MIGRKNGGISGGNIPSEAELLTRKHPVVAQLQTPHQQLTRAAELTADTIRHHATSVSEALRERMADCHKTMEETAASIGKFQKVLGDGADSLGTKLDACRAELAALNNETDTFIASLGASFDALASQIEATMKSIRDVRERITAEANQVAAPVFDAEAIAKKFGAGFDESTTPPSAG